MLGAACHASNAEAQCLCIVLQRACAMFPTLRACAWGGPMGKLDHLIL